MNLGAGPIVSVHLNLTRSRPGAVAYSTAPVKMGRNGPAASIGPAPVVRTGIAVVPMPGYAVGFSRGGHNKVLRGDKRSVYLWVRGTPCDPEPVGRGWRRITARPLPKHGPSQDREGFVFPCGAPANDAIQAAPIVVFREDGAWIPPARTGGAVRPPQPAHVATFASRQLGLF